jgi:hypothetical protein
LIYQWLRFQCGVLLLIIHCYELSRGNQMSSRYLPQVHNPVIPHSFFTGCSYLCWV